MVDFDVFFASPRWDILSIIAKTPASPLEISKQINTTVSYVSQQLKLLEAAGIVSKERTGAVERGKPRSIYSISTEILYSISLTKDFPEKKVIELTSHHKIILRIWSIEDSSLHYYIEKLFWQIEPNLKEIEGIFFYSNHSKELLIVSDSKKIISKISSLAKILHDKLKIKIVSKTDLLKLSSLHIIYDPNNISKQLKGGIKDNGIKEN